MTPTLLRLTATAALLLQVGCSSASALDDGPLPRGAGSPAYGAFGFDTAGMDRSVHPGDDFNAFANGSWLRSTQIPADRASYSVSARLQELSLDRTRQLLEEAEARPGSKIGDFYASFMDEATADRRGVAPLRPWMSEIAGVHDKRALAAVSASLQRGGVKTLFNMPGPLDQPVSPDDKHPRAEIFHLIQGGLGLPDRDYYLGADPELTRARGAYAAYLTQLLTLAGEGNVAARVDRVLAFEGALAGVHWSRADSREVDKTYHRWSPVEFAARAPGFDWTAYFDGLGVQGQPAILVAQPSAVSAEARLWAAQPLAVLKDHLLVHTLDAYALYLSRPFVEARFAFRGAALAGTPQQEPRWKRGVDLVSAQMRDAVGQAYVARYFPPEAEAAAHQIVQHVIAAWGERLKVEPWMAPATRVKALQKLAAMKPLIGHPQHWRDYSTLVITRGDLVGDVQRAYALEFQHQLDKLNAPTQRDDWDMTSMRADAEEDPVKNVIFVPAAILQPPYFDSKADLAVNYGGIGAFLGHEVSHLFDDQGRKYDPAGKLSDWWTPADVARFTALTGQLVKQYDAYEPLPGLHIQGRLTLGEDMADLAGLTVGYRAYTIALAGKPAPMLGGFTGDQRFFLGWAQIWRATYRAAALRQQLLSDPHPPGEYRVDEVRNRDEWYRAFSVTPDQRLYLPPTSRVQVW